MLSRTSRLLQRSHSRALSSSARAPSPLAAAVAQRPPVAPSARPLAASNAFPVLPSLVDPTSDEFVERARQMRDKEDELRQLWGKVLAGGGEKAQAKAKKAGKLLVRERWARLVTSPATCGD